MQPKPTAPASGVYAPATYPIFDRALSLSTSNQRDGGMQAYINVRRPAALGVVGSSSGSGTALSALDKTYYCVAGSTLSISDLSKGLLAGAVGANGEEFTGATGAVTAANLRLDANGTFSYAAPAGTAPAPSLIRSITPYRTYGDDQAVRWRCSPGDNNVVCVLAAAPHVSPIIFKSDVASVYASKPPGVFAGVTNYNRQPNSRPPRRLLVQLLP